MVLLECGCDRAKEIEGIAAHLLERGRPDSEIVTILSADYGVRFGSRGSGTAPTTDLELLSETMNRSPGVRGPAEVPSGARKTAPGG